MQQFGSWFTQTKPVWEEKLENASNYVIQNTGMSRKELTKLLHYLDEQNIIR